MSLRTSLEQLLDDLHKLEINTIEKPGLTAQKMPAPLLAIHDIVTSYERFDPSVHGMAAEGAEGRRTAGSLINRLKRLQRHAEERVEALRAADSVSDQGDRFIYNRIHQNTLTLLGILEQAQKERDLAREDGRGSDIETVLQQQTQSIARRREQDTTGPIPDLIYKMTADDLWKMDRSKIDRAWFVSRAHRAQIRKIWELGTERVVMQTVVQIEGDVTNRISPSIADRSNDRDYILAIHQQGVETSLAMWRSLVAVAKDLVSAVARAL